VATKSHQKALSLGPRPRTARLPAFLAKIRRSPHSQHLLRLHVITASKSSSTNKARLSRILPARCGVAQRGLKSPRTNSVRKVVCADLAQSVFTPLGAAEHRPPTGIRPRALFERDQCEASRELRSARLADGAQGIGLTRCYRVWATSAPGARFLWFVSLSRDKEMNPGCADGTAL
jgi:hypothetical protein